ncbi:hypothetical protein AB5N19_12715 [Seiridium cardinale]|uniref:Uncharacterized protein n=1 Tax=Seiridium cardinale TaxID=138064 RepID=A0ABR2Y0M5_9PEZI
MARTWSQPALNDLVDEIAANGLQYPSERYPLGRVKCWEDVTNGMKARGHWYGRTSFGAQWSRYWSQVLLPRLNKEPKPPDRSNEDHLLLLARRPLGALSRAKAPAPDPGHRQVQPKFQPAAKTAPASVSHPNGYVSAIKPCLEPGNAPALNPYWLPISQAPAPGSGIVSFLPNITEYDIQSMMQAARDSIWLQSDARKHRVASWAACTAGVILAQRDNIGEDLLLAVQQRLADLFVRLDEHQAGTLRHDNKDSLVWN